MARKSDSNDPANKPRPEESGSRLLLVESDAARRDEFWTALTAAGFYVETARNAEEAESVLVFAAPRLILLSMRPGDRSVLELAKRLKAGLRTKRIVILAVTEEAAGADAKLAYEAGCDGSVFRPFDARALPAIVGEFLRR